MENKEIMLNNLKVSERLVQSAKTKIMEDKKLSLSGYATVDKPWEKYYPKEVVNARLPKMSIYYYLLENNLYNMDRVALNYFDRKITYGEMFENIDKTAIALMEYGVKKGDIISIAMPTVPETVYLFYALSKIGAVANMIDPRTSKEGIYHYVEEANSKYLFIVDQAVEKASDIRKIDGVKDIITISPADSLPAPLNYGYRAKTFIENLGKKSEFAKSCKTWSEFFASGNSKKTYEFPDYEENLPVAIVHTGGTTGFPKGVMLSNDNLNAASFQCEIAGFDFKKTHKWLNIMPPFIAYGVGNGLHLPLACGMETILIPQFKPDEFPDLLMKYKPDHMVGVPSHYGHIINNKKMQDEDLSYIIAPTVGGDAMAVPLEAAVNDFLFRRGCPYLVTKGYGMTEVCAAVSACTTNETNKLGSVGIPFPHTTISIFDPETKKELRYGDVGEVCITGPNTMLGYLNNQEEQDLILKQHEDGRVWVHSGDLGKMDEDGCLYILGRMKNMIIRHDGFKVHPNTIAQVILKHPAVVTCSVVGVRDTNYVQGELPKAHIKIKDAYKDKEKEVIDSIKLLCEKELAEYQQPVDYKIRDTFPLTPIGKIDTIALQKEDEVKENVRCRK